MGDFIWRLKEGYIIDSRVKYFVAVQQCKGKPLLCAITIYRVSVLLKATCRPTIENAQFLCCHDDMFNDICHDFRLCCMACQLTVLSSVVQGR